MCDLFIFIIEVVRVFISLFIFFEFFVFIKMKIEFVYYL